jgi:hypothetical protein
MKNNTLFLLLTLILLCSSMIHAQDLVVDVSKLKDTSTLSTSFVKGFNVTFQKVPGGKGPEIKILNDQNIEEQILATKSGTTYTISFKYVERGLATKLPNGEQLKISGNNGVYISYNRKLIILKNKPTENEQGMTDPKIVRLSNAALSDAILISDLINKKDGTALSLLASLKNGTDVKLEYLLQLYSTNELMKQVLNEISEKQISTSTAVINGSGFSSIKKKVLNWDVTNATDGMSKFLVERAKQELSISFFRRFKDLINKEEYKDAQILFPRTMHTLNVIDRDVYIFDNYISSLREGFKEDLSLLLERMPQVISNGYFSPYFNRHPDIRCSALIGLFVAMEISEGSQPGNIISDIPTEYLEPLKNQDLKSSIKLLQIVSESLKSPGEEKYWLKKDSIKMLSNPKNNFLIARLYFAILYEQVGHIHFGEQSLTNKINEFALTTARLLEATKLINKIGEKIVSVENALYEIKKNKNLDPPLDLYHRVFLAPAEMLEIIADSSSLGAIGINYSPNANVKQYLSYLNNAGNLALNLNRRNYGSAMVDVFNLYTQYTGQRDHNSKLMSDQNKELTLKDSTLSVKAIKQANTDATKSAAFIKKYGNFMANVVNASSSSDISAAIRAVALPVGSASMKKENKFSISLNAFVGPYIGSEKIAGVDDGFKINAWGLTAPIGLSINKNIHLNNRAGWSASIFLSIVDIGAPVAFRFKDNETEQIPSIKLGDIVSPGAFLSIGIPNVPISFNVGYQTGPVLRELSESVADIASSRYSRISASLLVDIPLLNFLTSK